MKIKRSMKERICSNQNCKKTILRHMFYGESSQTVLRDKMTQLRVLKKFDWCQECALKQGGKK